MDKEVWKDIVGYEGIYQVSNFGRVKRISYFSAAHVCSQVRFPERILKATLMNTGYMRVRLLKKGTNKGMSIHRLVAQAFIPNPENKPQVNHINGIKTDNRLENLEWVSIKENVQHALTTGLKNSSIEFKIKMLKKITDEQAKKIREEYTPYSREYGASALAKKYGVSPYTIKQIIYNKNYKDI